MKRILIDTNIYSYALRGDQSVIQILQKAEVIGLSSISIGELISGFKGGNREKKNREELNIFLDSPRVQLFYIDEITADYYAEILNNLRYVFLELRAEKGYGIDGIGLRLSDTFHLNLICGISL